LNTDVRKFESSQKGESRAQSADSSKAYSKRRAFYCLKACKLKMGGHSNGVNWKWRTHFSHPCRPCTLTKTANASRLN